LNKRKNSSLLVPVWGIVIFTLLYIIATFLYPGGSQADKNSTGFSWANNYWCNLLNETAINGKYNAAKPVALVAMAVLCLTLSYFWFIFPKHVATRKYNRLTIQIAGIFAMAASLLLSADINHDAITNIASLFGLIAVTGTLAVLFRLKWYWLFAFGLFNILLTALNNYIYYSPEQIIYLPVIQKLTFAAFLIWISCISLKIYKNERKGS
jgi:hypothetical protein